MKKFFTKIIIFIVPFLLLLLIIDLILSANLKKTTEFCGEVEVWEDIFNNRIKSEIAIYGSSRAWLHIDPDIIEKSLGMKAYNFGIDGHNFWLQYLRHMEYIKYNQKPKIIIHSLDDWTFEKRIELYNMNQFLPYILWNKNFIRFTSPYLGYSVLDYYVPLLRYSNKFSAISVAIKSLLKNNPTPFRNKGFHWLDSNWNNDFTKAKKEKGLYLVKIDSALVDLYKQFLNECKANNIEVILVFSPEHFEGQKFIANRNDIINLYKQLAREYNLKFLDYSTSEICAKKQYFYNSLHLNKQGAEFFTKMLSQDLRKNITIDYY